MTKKDELLAWIKMSSFGVVFSVVIGIICLGVYFTMEIKREHAIEDCMILTKKSEIYCAAKYRNPYMAKYLYLRAKAEEGE